MTGSLPGSVGDEELCDGVSCDSRYGGTEGEGSLPPDIAWLPASWCPILAAREAVLPVGLEARTSSLEEPRGALDPADEAGTPTFGFTLLLPLLPRVEAVCGLLSPELESGFPPVSLVGWSGEPWSRS